MKKLLKKLLPTPFFNFLVFLKDGDIKAFMKFLSNKRVKMSSSEKRNFLWRLLTVSNHVESPHTQTEILTFATSILELPESVKGKVIEAGCYKGGSSAKFSIAAKKAGREFIVFDSYEGIPENNEPHKKNIYGGDVKFDKGDYTGTLEEVKSNVRNWGEIEGVSFVKGWLEDTLPHFNEPVAAVYVDVDLASSTKTAIKYLYPLLSPGGVLCSQDGHLPLVLEAINDDEFWEKEVGYKKPFIEGFGKSKLLKIVKN